MGNVTKKEFLQDAVAAGDTLVPTKEGIISIVHDMGAQQCHQIVCYLFSLWTWKFYQDFANRIMKTKFAAEFVAERNFKDLPQGFDLWVNSLETDEVDELYRSIKALTDERVSRWKSERPDNTKEVRDE